MMSFVVFFFFFKQKTAYEMRISDWSSDVCSSDLLIVVPRRTVGIDPPPLAKHPDAAIGSLLIHGGCRRIAQAVCGDAAQLQRFKISPAAGEKGFGNRLAGGSLNARAMVVPLAAQARTVNRRHYGPGEEPLDRNGAAKGTSVSVRVE